MNISSVIVKCLVEDTESVIARLEASKLCDVYAHDKNGKIIAVIEGESTEAESESLKQIAELPGVICADMVYAYSETEFSAQEGAFQTQNTQTLDEINSDKDALHIVYNGHPKD